MIEKKTAPYPFAFEGVAYAAMLPAKFLYPVFIRLPDARIVMQRFAGALWVDVTWMESFTGTIYDAHEASAPAKEKVIDPLIDQLQGAIIFTGLSAGAVYGLVIDGGRMHYAGRMGTYDAQTMLVGKTRLLTVDGDENDITGLWLPE